MHAGWRTGLAAIAAAGGLWAGVAPAQGALTTRTDALPLTGPPVGLEAVDADADGHQDLLVVQPEANAVRVLLGRGDGTFEAGRDVPGGASAMTTGDVNGDGHVDLLTNVGSSTGPSLSVLLGDGRGGFGPTAADPGLQAVSTYPSLGASDLAFGDLDFDGHGDVLVASSGGGITGLPDLGVLLGRPDGTLAPVERFDLDLSGARRVAHDPISSFAFVSGFKPGLRRFVGPLISGSGTLVDLLPTDGVPDEVRIADLNGDGASDVVTRNGQSLSRLLGQPGLPGSFSPLPHVPTAGAGTGLALADLDGDGHVDAAATDDERDAVEVLRGAGDGSLTRSEDLPVADGAGEAIAADFDGDGFADLAVTHGARFRAADGVPPQLTVVTSTTEPRITDGGPDVVGRSTSFAFDASRPGASFTCKLTGPDGAARETADCVSPVSYTRLRTGDWTFAVEARDPAGHLEAPAATRAFRVEADAASPTITEGPSGATTQDDVTFKFTTEADDVTAFCRLLFDSRIDVIDEDCASPKAYEDLAEGSYEFTVLVTEGDSTSVPATRFFTVDRTAPRVTLSGTSGPVSGGFAGFLISSSEPSQQLTCSLTGPGHDGTAAPCPSPLLYSGLADGSYTFVARVTDAAGNVGEATSTFLVDTVPPEVTATAREATAAGVVVDVKATDASSGVASIRMISDATLETTPGDTASLLVSEPGPQSVIYTAFDKAGNAGGGVIQVTLPRETSTLTAERGLVTTSSGKGRTGAVAATLVRASKGTPLAGRTITFTAGNGSTICSAVTGETGRAACTGPIPQVSSPGYLARFAGDEAYFGSTATADFNGGKTGGKPGGKPGGK